MRPENQGALWRLWLPWLVRAARLGRRGHRIHSIHDVFKRPEGLADACCHSRRDLQRLVDPNEVVESWLRLFGQRPAEIEWNPAGLC